MNTLNTLLEELQRLHTRMADAKIPLIIGGGMGLYLRDIAHLPGIRSPRYPERIDSRSTEDLDVFLSPEVIIDAERMLQLKTILGPDGLGCDVIPSARCFQFVRDTEHGMTVKVDLLAAPPPDSDRDKVKITPPRIRPKAASKIHGRLTSEAAGVHFELIELSLDSLSPPSEDAQGETIFIPSSLNYLILKLNAFHDRKHREDSDMGRHHAFDIFRIVADMRQRDWESAERHIQVERERVYMKRAARLQRDHFDDVHGLGFTRLRENKAFLDTFDTNLEHLAEDMVALFSKIEPIDTLDS